MTLGVKLKLGDAVSVRGQEEQGAGDPQGHRATRTWSLSLMNAVNPEDRPHSGFEAAEEEREEPGDRAGRGPSRTLTDTEERAEDEKKPRPELESQRGKTERRKRILRAEKRHLPTGSRTQQTPSRKSKCESRRSREKLQKTRRMETRQSGTELESSGLWTSR